MIDFSLTSCAVYTRVEVHVAHRPSHFIVILYKVERLTNRHTRKGTANAIEATRAKPRTNLSKMTLGSDEYR